ncbi:Rieske 2Fe-2S domain-containing protein [Pedobacter sp. Du54]|uniref:QcrA and Rieske domain-containing protein n=1 Tax=Pedobacter anseongensis TaxID=3133439 RepID=UPI0030952AC8
MERNEFIKSLGLGVALVCTGSCLSSCGGKKSDNPTPTPNPGGGGQPSGITASIDISSALTSVGSFTTVNGVLFVRLETGNATSSFTATQATCPHQGGALNWIAASNLIQCALHSSQYTASGSVARQPNDGGTTSPLKVYPLTLTGTTLTATVK